MNNFKAVSLSIALLTASGSALAAPKHHATGAYVGADFGNAELSLNETSQTYDSTNFRAFLGYQLNRYFAVEGGVSSMQFENELGAVADLTGIDVSLLAMLPITSKFSAYAKLGYWDWESDNPNDANDISITNSDVLYGIGLEYKISTRFRLRLNATRYQDGGDDEIDTVNGSLAYRF